MSIQESSARKAQSFHFALGLYRAGMMIVLGLVALLCLVHWTPFTEVSAAQNNNAGGDPNHGREIFEKRCTGCHALDNEKEGPRLRGVFGRKSGSVPTFKYSDAVKSANVTWDADSLDRWLTDPDKFIPDNDMDFHLAKADERSDVIAYLKRLSNQ